MVIEEVKWWYLYDKLKFCVFGENVKENIIVFFNWINKEYGCLFVLYFIGYLIVIKLGLSELELFDIMLIDEVLFEDVDMKCSDIFIRRMLLFLMVWLVYDLELFIIEREVDGIFVIFWKYK